MPQGKATEEGSKKRIRISLEQPDAVSICGLTLKPNPSKHLQTQTLNVVENEFLTFL